MKTALLILAALSLTPQPASAEPARPEPARPEAMAAPSQDSRKAFREKFQQYKRIGAEQEMADLVRKNVDEAVTWVIETTEAIAARPSDELYERIAALREAWKTGMKTGFVSRMEEYYSLLRPMLKRERDKIKRAYDEAVETYQENLEEKDGPTFELLAGKFRGLAEAFEEVGDYYYGGNAWSFYANCNEDHLRGNKADLKEAARGYKSFVRLRDEIELKDPLYLRSKPRMETLIGQGFDPDAATTEPEVEAGPSEGGTSITAAMSYELVPEVDAVERPSYYLDEHYPMWNQLYLKEKGSQVAVPRLNGLVTAIRVGSSEIQLDTDGDGKGDVEIPLTGNLEPVEMTIGEGPEERRWSFLSTLGVQKDVYQGIQMNLEPTTNMFNVYMAPSASVRGEIAGVEIQVFDDNLDGVYGSPPLTWAHVGVSEGLFQPEMDSIRIGGEDRALPWSEYQKIDDQWYKLESLDAGTRITATPVELKTGTLELDYDGPDPTYVIVRGVKDFENSYFDLVAGGSRGVEVPAGSYSLYYGELREGKKRQLVKSLMLPGPQTREWVVTPGETVEIEMGEPFSFDFRFEESEDSFTVIGSSVVVVGRAGERYERVWGAVPRPEIHYREKGKRRGKDEDMDYVGSQDEVTELGWNAAWFPQDTTIRKPGSGDDIEVKLVEDRNDLFGDIESDWKD